MLQRAQFPLSLQPGNSRTCPVPAAVAPPAAAGAAAPAAGPGPASYVTFLTVPVPAPVAPWQWNSGSLYIGAAVTGPGFRAGCGCHDPGRALAPGSARAAVGGPVPVGGPAPASSFAPAKSKGEARSSLELETPAQLDARAVAGQAQPERAEPSQLGPLVAVLVRVERAAPSRTLRSCLGTESRTRIGLGFALGAPVL
jgi:hypothetical protein